MDIIEFAEKFMDVELKDWQKKHLRVLDDLRKDADIRIVMPKSAGRKQVYIYMNTYKELFGNVKTTNYKY